jgi:2'-5' RNA ligase
MRLFTAFDPSDELRDALSEVRSWTGDVPLSVRWSDPAQYHCTLRFIGEVERAEAEALRSALREVDRPGFRAEPHGLTALPGRRNPRVLVVALDLSSPLRRLYRAVTSALQEEGIDPEKRSYRPHITLGRFDDPDREVVHRFLKRHREASFPAFPVSGFHLYESTLTPSGAVHDIVESYDLTPPPEGETD